MRKCQQNGCVILLIAAYQVSPRYCARICTVAKMCVGVHTVLTLAIMYTIGAIEHIAKQEQDQGTSRYAV